MNINIHERCQFTHPKDYSPRVIASDKWSGELIKMKNRKRVIRAQGGGYSPPDTSHPYKQRFIRDICDLYIECYQDYKGYYKGLL